MSRHSFVFSSRSLRSLELEREALERDRLRRRYQSMCVARAQSFKPQGTGTPGPEPGFLCEDPLVHNALFTGDNQRVRQLFGNKWPQNLLLLASGHDLEWHSEKPEGPAWELWQALLLGDEETLVLLISDPDQSNLHPNVIFDTSDVEQWKNYRYNLRALRIWSLCYKQEFITPLQITASRGYDKCLQHLLTSGADVDFAPGGKTALHEACENSQSECTRLLLTYGANPNAISEDGYTPLHLCSAPESLRCAELLLRFGCNVNSRTEDKGDTALHIAARFALEGHVQLYLHHGASVNRLNESEQSPLHCVCAQSHSSEDADRYFRVCHYLVEHGASVEALDEEKQSALHLACRTVNHRMVDLLLSKGIDVNRMDYGGNAPMHKALQAVAYKLEHEPERTVRSLLNYGSIRIWPGAIPKVLRYCCQSPRTIEVLVNVYDRLKVTDDWVESVPLKVLQEHQDFYESLFALSQTPRSLQHLARCAIRRHFEGHCQEQIPQLPLPTFLKDYLLLQFQGYIS